MKIKYAILKANRCHGYWSYYGVPIIRDKYIIDEHNDRFLCSDVTNAQLYDSEDDALKAIESFNELRRFEMDFDKKIENFYGSGIYKTEKIYILEIE